MQSTTEAADDDDEPDIDVGGFILIPGSVKAIGPVSHHDLIAHVNALISLCCTLHVNTTYLPFHRTRHSQKRPRSGTGTLITHPYIPVSTNTWSFGLFIFMG
jgi:hypothetical protein